MGEGDGMKYMTLPQNILRDACINMRRFMKRGITHLLPFDLESASGSIIERMHIRHFFITRGNILLRQKKSIRLMSAFYTW